MNDKQWIPVASLALLAVLNLNPAMAHGGDRPMHGGVVQVANDISFELVVEADGATIYLTDHGKPMASKGINGKLTALQGSNKIEAVIKESGENKLEVTGVKLGKGDRLVAVLNNLAGKSMTVRFTLK
jgi:hypothetical protein